MRIFLKAHYNESVYDIIIKDLSYIVDDGGGGKYGKRGKFLHVSLDGYFACYLSFKVNAINVFPMVAGQCEGFMSDITLKPASHSWVKYNALHNWMDWPSSGYWDKS